MRNITKSFAGLAIALAVTAGSISLFAQGQWGSGPVKVAIVTKGHNFDRDGFFNFWDSLGQDITWTHVQHPAALEFFDPALADTFDVYVFFDAPGRTATPGPDGKPTYEQPNASAKKNLIPFLQKGKGLVFFHHSPAAWNHTWPEYSEMIGMACDWGNPVTFKGKSYPNSGAQANVKQHITVVNKTHPDHAGSRRRASISSTRRICARSTRRPRG